MTDFRPSQVAIPEQGQIVRVRQRVFTVTEVRSSALPSLTTETPMRLVTLASVEDDALGETIQILWELEPGVQIIEKAELPSPDTFDPANHLEAFLDAVRWGAASQADHALLQSPFRSGIKLEDYQLNPLVRAVQMPRVSLMIADDVGLGKTVEAGLVIQELISRNRARSVLVVCPAGLLYHWRDQMREKFGLDFRIINTETMRELRRTRGLHVNPWSHFPRLITSMDFIKRERPLRLFHESVQGKPDYPRPFDILVIDEAHNVAPSGSGQYSLDSQRTRAVRQIVPYFEHHIFLSATPHNGFPESFSALLELLDNQRFARGVPPNPQQLEAVMIRRLKRDLNDEFGNPRFKARKIIPLEVELTDAEREIHTWLREYAALRRQRASTREAQYASEFIHKLLKKRLLSSPEAFRSTLEVHRASATKSHTQRSLRAETSISVLQRQIARTDEDYASDEELDEANESAVTLASGTIASLTSEEETLLARMLDWAEDASDRPDSRTKRLLNWLHSVMKPDGIWNNERVILFTEYRATQRWLQNMLVASGLGDRERLALIFGGMDDEERERIKAAFQAAPGPDNKLRVLLATDAASEGIDLQNHCHRLVHVEIPWNPNRLEQRNGRIDRMGQRFSPEIYHFVPKGYERAADELVRGRSMSELDGDLEFLGRVVEKLDRMREDLAGKVGNVIAEQVEEVMTGARQRVDLRRLADSTAPARAQLQMERKFDEIIQRQIRKFYSERHNMHLTSDNVQKVVEVALELGGQPKLQPAAARPGAFYLPPLRGSTWNLARTGLAHPFTGEERPIVFDEALMTDDQVVLAHLNHPLVLLAQRLLRAEIWSGQGKLSRVTARLVPDHALDQPALVGYARLVVIGGARYRLHEELITAGGKLTFGDRPSFRRFSTVGELNKALDAATLDEPDERALTALQQHWNSFAPSLRSALDARMQDRLEAVTNQLAERQLKEQEDIVTVLNELANTIRSELKPVDQPLLPGFSDTERDQYLRDMAALEVRLERIPAEILREQDAIRARYANLQPRLFPVAVALLIPERLG